MSPPHRCSVLNVSFLSLRTASSLVAGCAHAVAAAGDDDAASGCAGHAAGMLAVAVPVAATVAAEGVAVAAFGGSLIKIVT